MLWVSKSNSLNSKNLSSCSKTLFMHDRLLRFEFQIDVKFKPVDIRWLVKPYIFLMWNSEYGQYADPQNFAWQRGGFWIFAIIFRNLNSNIQMTDEFLLILLFFCIVVCRYQQVQYILPFLCCYSYTSNSRYQAFTITHSQQ